MPDNTLFPSAGQMLGGVAQAATENDPNGLNAKKSQAETASKGAAEVAATGRQKMAGQQDQQLAQLKAQLDQASNMMEITPQIALGLVKNTGDKEWLKTVGQKMRSDVVMAMYTHGIKEAQQKNSPKVSEVYNKDGTIGHVVVYKDENGDIQQIPIDAGMASDLLNKGKGGKSGGKVGADKTLDALRSWNKDYNAKSGQVMGANGKQLQATDPDAYKNIKQWVDDNKDTYDSNMKTIESKGTGGGAPARGSGTSSAASGTLDSTNDDLFKFDQ